MGLCLDIVAPVDLHASVNADATGTAVLTQTIPEFVPIGTDLWFQAVVPRGATGLSWIKSPEVPITTANAPLVASAMVPGDLVISEVMIDPVAVADNVGEWFEIYNASGLDANLDGLTLTDGINNHPIAQTVFLPAGGYAVVGVNADPLTNGGVEVDHQYNGLSILDQWGELYILYQATVIDGVAWGRRRRLPPHPRREHQHQHPPERSPGQ